MNLDSNYSLLLYVKVLKRNSLRQMKSRTWVDVTPQTMAQNYDHYKHFMDEFASQVVGQVQFDIRSCERVPELWLPAAGEAFALLSIENYMEWADKDVRNSPTAAKHKIGKWNNNSNASRFEGMGTEGLNRYEELYGQVLEARKKDSRRKLAEKYKKYRQDDYDSKQNGMKKKAVPQQPTKGKKLKLEEENVVKW